MYSFNNDYSESAHPRIISAIQNMGLEQNDGYGIDDHCAHAAQLIKDVIHNDQVDVHFFPGGTITNLSFISYTLKPYEAVIGADTAHINIHETGAIEASGHKILDIPTPNGKLTPELIQPVLDLHESEHWVLPKMVYISNPTEVGTIYTKEELTTLRNYCLEKNLFLYLDGARMAMALTAPGNDLDITDFAKLTDAFYIGGTKVGAMFGEALVLVNENLREHFRFNMKQRGAIMAKGWLLGMQFEALFQDDLYFQLGQHANDMAALMKQAFCEAGFSFIADAPTNQLFPILPDWLVKELDKHYLTSFWSKPDEKHTCIRFCTSWATKKEDVLHFISHFQSILKAHQ